ncbi:MAG: glycosyltransferase [Chitinophagaceae bacterium]|nr:MAG: glycosyltransferase [Chitinophagaceae bacterium]
MPQKKILFITCEFYWGGAQKSFLKVLHEVAKNYECFIAVFDAGGQSAYQNIKIFSLDHKQNVKMNKVSRFMSRVRELKRLKRQLQITHSISFMDGADVLNILSRQRGEKIITSVRASIEFNDAYADSMISNLRRKYLFPVIYKKADNVVAVSKAIKAELVKNYRLNADKVVPIYNFYDPDEYVRRKEEPIPEPVMRLFETRKTITAVGRLDKQKNFLNLVQVFAACKALATDLVLLIIGTGEDLPQLVSECHKLNLKVHSYEDEPVTDYASFDVLLLGYEENPHKYVARSTIFVLPSKWEGFPNALAEAMLVGATCISADCPTGPSEIITNGEDGILLPVPVSSSTHQQWVETILGICNGNINAKRFGSNAMQKMKSFSKINIVPQWMNLLK